MVNGLDLVLMKEQQLLKINIDNLFYIWLQSNGNK